MRPSSERERRKGGDRELERAKERIVRVLTPLECTVALDTELPIKETLDPARVDVAIRRRCGFLEWLVVGFCVRGRRRIDDLLLDELRFRGESLDADHVFALTNVPVSAAVREAARGFRVEIERAGDLDEAGALGLAEVHAASLGDSEARAVPRALTVFFEGPASGVELAYTAEGAEVARTPLLSGPQGRKLTIGMLVRRSLELDARRAPRAGSQGVTVRRGIAGDWRYEPAKGPASLRAVASELTHVPVHGARNGSTRLRAAATTWSIERERARFTIAFA